MNYKYIFIIILNLLTSCSFQKADGMDFFNRFSRNSSQTQTDQALLTIIEKILKGDKVCLTQHSQRCHDYYKKMINSHHENIEKLNSSHPALKILSNINLNSSFPDNGQSLQSKNSDRLIEKTLLDLISPRNRIFARRDELNQINEFLSQNNDTFYSGGGQNSIFNPDYIYAKLYIHYVKNRNLPFHINSTPIDIAINSIDTILNSLPTTSPYITKLLMTRQKITSLYSGKHTSQGSYLSGQDIITNLKNNLSPDHQNRIDTMVTDRNFLSSTNSNSIFSNPADSLFSINSTSNLGVEFMQSFLNDFERVEQSCRTSDCINSFSNLFNTWQAKISQLDLSQQNKEQLMNDLKSISDQTKKLMNYRMNLFTILSILNLLDDQSQRDLLDRSIGVDTDLMNEFLKQNENLKSANISDGEIKKHSYFVNQKDALLYLLQSLMFASHRNVCLRDNSCFAQDQNLIRRFIDLLHNSDFTRSKIQSLLSSDKNQIPSLTQLVRFRISQNLNINYIDMNNIEETFKKIVALEKLIQSKNINKNRPQNLPKKISIRRNSSYGHTDDFDNNREGWGNLFTGIAKRAARDVTDNLIN